MAVEKVSQEIEAIVSLSEEIEWLGEGYGGFDEKGQIEDDFKVSGNFLLLL